MIQFPPLQRGALIASLAANPADLAAALELRRIAFRQARGLDGGDGDGFDPVSQHVLIRDGQRVMATFRLRPITRDTASYTAQFYDLSGLPDTPMLELGRLCLHPDAPDPDTLRLTLAVLTRAVDGLGASHLIGCTSLPGTELAAYGRALGAVRAHVSPLTPATAPEVLALADLVPQGPQLPLPALLGHYLSLGGILSDHAVVDRALQTCHVLTLLCVADIPPARAKILRQMTE